jgi:hypothetical protein
VGKAGVAVGEEMALKGAEEGAEVDNRAKEYQIKMYLSRIQAPPEEFLREIAVFLIIYLRMFWKILRYICIALTGGTWCW